ncbi:MAG: sugar-binding protein, partial [Candidatus Aenigmatarchaeota archaeon]
LKKIPSACLFAFLFAFGFLSSTALAGKAQLSWEPPTTNADGTPLTDLAGYKVYYGTSKRVSTCPNETHGYSNVVNVGNVTTYKINNLPDGFTYYFSVTAYDTSGNEGCFSEEVNKTIPIYFTKTPFTINLDGVVSEQIWNHSFSAFSKPLLTDNTVKVYSLWDEQKLYFGFEVTDNSIETVQSSRDSNVMDDDSVEILIDTLNDGSQSMQNDDYRFVISANGVVWDGRGNGIPGNSGDSSWNSQVSVNSRREGGKYTIEVAIPLSDIGMVSSYGKIVGLFFAVNDRDSGSLRRLYMNETADLNTPKNWAKSILMHRSDENRNSCIEMTELLSFIGFWQSDSTAYPIKELMETIGFWKKGC